MAADRVLILPAGALAELTYMIEKIMGSRKLEQFLASLIRREMLLDWHQEDLPRALQLITRYSDLPLGYVDAAVIACAERHGGRVLTIDYRHFGVVAREGTIQIVS